MLFRKILSVYTEKHMGSNAETFNVKVESRFINHCDLHV
jgi:hypothetical protein